VANDGDPLLVESGAAAPSRCALSSSRWCRHPKPDYPPPTGCRRVYIPIYGYLDADDDHRTRLERLFHLPMLILALLVLPVLGLEWLQSQQNYSYIGQDILEHPASRIATTLALVFIWLMFGIEFTVKISVATSRLQYAARNWLDIVIILLPMLRPLRAMGAARVAQLGRVYTLRGVAMKLLRTALGLMLGMEAVRRLRERFRKPAERPGPASYSQWSRAALISEIRRLQARIEVLQRHEQTPEDRHVRNVDP
jgi:hypothetical protein